MIETAVLEGRGNSTVLASLRRFISRALREIRLQSVEAEIGRRTCITAPVPDASLVRLAYGRAAARWVEELGREVRVVNASPLKVKIYHLASRIPSELQQDI